MADDEVGGEGREEGIGERGGQFFARLGIPHTLYNFANVLENAIAFAALTAVPDAQNRAWVPLGARNIGGRVRALQQDPTNPSRLYAGMAQGGLWKTEDGGDTWTPCGRPQESFPVGCLAIAPSNPDIVYVGTGEPVNINGAASLFPSGVGILRYIRSTNNFAVEVNGATGVGAAGMGPNYSRICVDPRDATRYWIGATDGLWRRNPPGATFTQEALTGLAPPYVVSDVALVPRTPGDPDHFFLYAAVATQGIYRAEYNRGTAVGALTLIGGVAGGGGAVALPTGAANVDRIRLGWCENVPSRIYALFENPVTFNNLDLYRSNDFGDTWFACADPEPTATAQGAGPSGPYYAWWTMSIGVHPHQPDVIVTGASDMFLFTDGGASAANRTQVMNWVNFYSGDRGQHADIHEIFFDRFDPHKLWYASDAGVAIAPDILSHNPLSVLPNERRRFAWRRRSQDILAAQFIDITVNREFPQLMGGGLQDNGTFMGVGGDSWYLVDGGDGAEMCFEVGNARTRFTTSQFRTPKTNTAVVSTTPPPGGGSFLYSNPATPENAPPANTVTSLAAPTAAFPAGLTSPFIPVIEHHPTLAGHMLFGGRNDGAVTTTAGAGWTRFGLALTAPATGARLVSTVAYSPSAPGTDWWAGSNGGDVFSTRDAGATAWVARLPGWFAVAGSPGPQVSRIIVHPTNPDYVVVCAGGHSALAAAVPPINPAGLRQVFLTRNRGGAAAAGAVADWVDISGDANVNGGGAGTLRALPPSPVTCAAFDLSIPAASPQVLYVGTLVGVFVIRNLPPATGAALGGAAIPGFNPEWRSFNNAAPVPATAGQLPLTLVNDMVAVTTPGDLGGQFTKLRVATFGRGIYECDIGAPVANTQRRLYIRQHSTEDGWQYPRPTTAVMNGAFVVPNGFTGDPRYPALPAAGSVAFSDVDAYDIRVDNAVGSEPLFFEERVDGVEFDEEIGVKNLVPGEKNFVYVQAHNRGWDVINDAVIHLYFNTTATAPPAFPVFAPAPNALPATFWNPPSFDPITGGATPSSWTRVAPAHAVPRLRPGEPYVARFEWVPPIAVQSQNVTLLAMVDSRATDQVPAAAPATIDALIRDVRHAALRVVPAAAFVPNIYIRDGHEDRGVGPGVAFGGRSPDIMVLQGAPARPLRDEFADLADLRRRDQLKGAGPNFIYVRVHNAKAVDVQARVTLWWVKPTARILGDINRPAFDETSWSQVGLVPAVSPAFNVPANDWEVTLFRWDNPGRPDPGPDADAHQAYLLIALIEPMLGGVVIPGDPLPQKPQVTNVENFWHFFRTQREAGNAAMRGVRWSSS